MAGRIFQQWYQKWKNRRHISDNKSGRIENNVVSRPAFSPLTYQNPCISCMQEIIERVIRSRQISYQKLELVILDVESDKDEEDIQEVLWQVSDRLNYLMLVTDRPDYFEDYSDAVFDQTGLIVQYISKNSVSHVRGNLLLDFERSSGLGAGSVFRSEIIYLPVYKKAWEIAENLDIIVPVGYNTLIVDGIFLPHPGEYCSMNKRFMNEKIDRLDQEFRKG